MSNIDFSVAMSVYKNDNAIHFERALDSITELQTVKPSEIVLVVDGPIGDELNAVITKYEKKYSQDDTRCKIWSSWGFSFCNRYLSCFIQKVIKYPDKLE